MNPAMTVYDAVEYAIYRRLSDEPAFHDVTIHQGWPSDVHFKMPAISIMASDGSYLCRGDNRIYQTVEIDGIQYTDFLIGFYTFSISLNLWTKSKTQRSQLDHILRSLFYPIPKDTLDTPPPQGLLIPILPHNLTVRISMGVSQRFDEITASNGFYRMNYDLHCQIPSLNRIKTSSPTYKPTVQLDD